MNVIQDQNFSVLFDGVKAKGSTVQKNKRGLGGRKALNDISNTSRKQNPKTVIPIGEEVKKKAQVRGRKALVDLTNSVKPIPQQQKKSHKLTKKNQGKKSIAIAEEGFLHNHDECVKSQNKSLDLDFDAIDEFPTPDGHNHDACIKARQKALNLEFPDLLMETIGYEDENESSMVVEMEEVLVPMIEDGIRYPICESPNFFSEQPESPKFFFEQRESPSYWKKYDESPSPTFLEFDQSFSPITVKETP